MLHEKIYTYDVGIDLCELCQSFLRVQKTGNDLNVPIRCQCLLNDRQCNR